MGFSDYLSQTFPGVRVTSGRRDPNSALGRANPKSWHNKGMAWDIAPIPGMTFDQYRDRVKGDGWNVVEAIDEVSNPSKHATGPHWHMAVNGRKEPQPMAGNGLASLMQGIYPLAQQEDAAPATLASLLPLSDAPLQQPVMPGDQPGIPEMPRLPGVKPKGRGTANDIMGTIFDALAALGGAQPSYWSGVVGQQQQQRQEEADGRKWLQQLMAQREQKQADREAEQAQWVQRQEYERANPSPSSMETDLAAWNRMTPEQKAQYAAMQDIKSPIAVSGPQGTYRVARTVGQPPAIRPGTIEDGHEYVGGDPASPSSWRKVQ